MADRPTRHQANASGAQSQHPIWDTTARGLRCVLELRRTLPALALAAAVPLHATEPLTIEWDLCTRCEHVANGRADDFARDTHKVWVQVEYKGKWMP